MSYQIRITILEDSPEGKAIASLVEQGHVSAQDAAKQLIREAVRYPRPEPVEGAIGSVNNDGISIETNDEAVFERPSKTRRGPRAPQRKNAPEAIIGLFAGDESFRKSIDSVISRRAERYGLAE